ncbi:hypothetical protein NOF55_15650 [Rhizobiaceae bacterium BDR2-2]|uniref:Lipoprotein n=1 Tax=Ectorhizobium quercum TaxID=2965071 RepID=A0AAE3N244_9HYPH|nr:hypothetical protein [Ectorhizobium quercum]MCX8998547.1 hypothetical protein [Ectorhizobium quercum]
MNIRIITLAGLALALGGCVTATGAQNGIEKRWNGQQAGAFFAKFGPPVTDQQIGASTIYTWRGGYRTRTVQARYAEGSGGRRGALLSPARTEYLRCEVQLTVSPDYVIRSVRTIIDKPGVNGAPSYCEEFLGGD